MHNKLYYINSNSHFHIGFSKLKVIAEFEAQDETKHLPVGHGIKVEVKTLPFRTDDVSLLDKIKEKLKDATFFDSDFQSIIQEAIDEYCNVFDTSL